MDGTKSPFLSKGIWGGVAAMIVGAAQMLGYTAAEADAAQMSDLMFGAATAITGLIATIGRIFATKRIG